jgi:hypothetical protein
MPGLANDLNISQPGYVVHNGSGVFTGRTFQAGTGITLSNPDGIAGNTTISSTAAATDLHTARFIVASSTSGTGANFTSITSAVAAAQGTGINSTIFLQPGTYTENFSLPAGINLSAYTCDSFTPNVTIVGTITMNTAGTVSISGIRLQTNSAALLAVTGSAASIVNLNECYLNCTNNTGITFSTSSASGRINITNCTADVGTTGIGLFAHSSNGKLVLTNLSCGNSGATTTTSTCSAGSLAIINSQINLPIAVSGAGTTAIDTSNFDNTGTNTTCLALTGTGSSGANWSRFYSGTASAISVGSGTTFNSHYVLISSSNTNGITGGGTINYDATTFGTSKVINVTTQSGGTLIGSQNTAPAAGFLGEQITSGSVIGTSVSNGTPKTIASITLTAGVWDITGIGYATSSAFVLSLVVVGISTSTNTIQGSYGDQKSIFSFTSATGTDISLDVPAFRVVISSSTTYFLVMQANFGSGTASANARISAVRVG